MSAPLDAELSPALFADFAQAVWHADPGAIARLADRCSAPPARTAASLHIHASTTQHTLARALAEAAPSVAAVLSESAWQALATDFIAQHPPRRAALYQWGDDMPAFLQLRGASAQLIGLAQLDRAALTAFFAAESAPITASALANFTTDEIQRVRLTLHPSLQRLRLPTAAAQSWLNLAKIPLLEQRHEAAADGCLVVVIRPDAQVRLILVSPATDALLGALGRGSTLIEGCEEALSHDGQLDFQSVLAALFADGTFIACDLRE